MIQNLIINKTFCGLLMMALCAPAQTSALKKDHAIHAAADSVGRDLAKNGFENVAVIDEDTGVIVAYENRIYRDEIKALTEALRIVRRYSDDKSTVILIPQNQRIPLVAVTIPASNSLTMNRELVDEGMAAEMVVSTELDSIWQKVQLVPKENSSSLKFDIVVHPQFRAQFGNRRDPVEAQVNVAPELRTSLWKGMGLSAQIIIPVHNELAGEENHIRPEIIALNQTLRLPNSLFLSAAAGYFTEQRFGLDLNIRKYVDNGRWSFAANLGYTGFASYHGGVWSYSDINLLTANFSAEYRVPNLNLILKTTFGRFLEKDRGVRCDAVRQFGEVDFGFYFIKTDAGDNGGFNFSIPIFPSRYLPANRIRVSPAPYFTWEYRYRRLDASGRQFETGNDLRDFSKRLNPDYTKNQLLEF
jgi:hypothetical protein